MAKTRTRATANSRTRATAKARIRARLELDDSGIWLISTFNILVMASIPHFSTPAMVSIRKLSKGLGGGGGGGGGTEESGF